MAPLDEGEIFHLWPECVAGWQLWLEVQTQWRYASLGMGGSRRTGLDYAGVHAHMTATRRLRPARHRELWGMLQAAEAAALEEWRKAAR